jgi:NADH-quinone oxidoreductase subunit N
MAIAQDSVKRLLAYSGVAHAGYILIGVVAGTQAGVTAVLFYLIAYLFMNFGAFAVLFVLTAADGEHDRLADLDGIGRRHPWLGLLMTVFMLSLAGFPPSVGFFGKFFLFAAGVSAGYTWLVVLAVLMSVVSVYYYFRVLLHVWALVPEAPTIRTPAGVGAVATIAGIASVVLGLYPTLLFVLGQAGAAPLAH